MKSFLSMVCLALLACVVMSFPAQATDRVIRSRSVVVQRSFVPRRTVVVDRAFVPRSTVIIDRGFHVPTRSVIIDRGCGRSFDTFRSRTFFID